VTRRRTKIPLDSYKQRR